MTAPGGPPPEPPPPEPEPDYGPASPQGLPWQGPPDAPAAPPALPPLPPPPPPRSKVGKYVIKRELGRGGMGAVYLAEQPSLGREVAIKELIVSAGGDPSALPRFMQEARVMARSNHPNLVQIHDTEQEGDSRFIIFEFVRGRSLREMLARGRVPLPRVFAIMHGVLLGLNHAHRNNIVHRDMKPENVLVGDEGTVKISDFGIARLTDEAAAAHATRTGTTVGTPQYMSPEQVSTSRVDGRSDLYSAGIMLYEVICGRPPFTAAEGDGPFTLMAKHVQAPPPPVVMHRPDVDPELEQVIMRALAKRPEERFQTGAEFDAALRRVADRVCPGWELALEPGADLSRMTAAAPSAPASAPTMTFPPVPPGPPASPAPVPPAPSGAPLPPPLPAPIPPAATIPGPRPAGRRSGCLWFLAAALGAGAAVALAAAPH